MENYDECVWNKKKGQRNGTEENDSSPRILRKERLLAWSVVDLHRQYWLDKHLCEILTRHTLLSQRQIIHPHERRDDCLQLDIGKRLTNATMTAGAKGQVGVPGSTTGNLSESVINRLSRLLLLDALPAVRVERHGVLVELLVDLGGNGRSGNVVTLGDDVVGSGESNGTDDLAEDHDDWGAETKGFADNVLEEGHVLHGVKGEGSIERAEDVLLLSEELLDEVRVLGEVEEGPGGGGRGGVLTGHEEGNHQVAGVNIREGGAVLVGLVEKRLEHIGLVGDVVGATLVDDLLEDVAHLDVGVVAAEVRGEGEPFEEHVDGLETVIQVVVQLGDY